MRLAIPLFGLVLAILVAAPAIAQQPPAKPANKSQSPNTQSPNRQLPSQPPAPQDAPPLSAPRPSVQAVQPSEAESSRMQLAWASFENAQLKLQLNVTAITAVHPGWKYDYDQKVFYVEVTSPAAATPAPPAAK